MQYQPTTGNKEPHTTDYQSIIDHPHHVSARHPRMSMQNRAAQFAPFSALAGYEESIRNTAEAMQTLMQKS